MMSVNSTPASDLRLRDRVSFKVTALFIATFLTIFIGSSVYGAFTALLAGQVSDAELQSQPEVVAMDPKLQSSLAKVMTFDAIPNSAEIKDPFKDGSGISNNGQNFSAGTTNRTTAKVVGSDTTAKKTPSGTQGGKTNNGAGTTTKDPKETVVEDTLTRILAREEKLRNGQEVGLESGVFAIEDLLPVGVVSGGEGADEIMFYSQSADRTFSYPVGTQFYDGWLTEIRNEGAVFSFNDQGRTMRLKSWVRSIKTKSGVNSGVGSNN